MREAVGSRNILDIVFRLSLCPGDIAHNALPIRVFLAQVGADPAPSEHNDPPNMRIFTTVFADAAIVSCRIALLSSNRNGPNLVFSRRVAVEVDLSARGLFDPGDLPDEGGFPCAIVPHDRHVFAFAPGEGRVLKGVHTAVMFGQVPYLQNDIQHHRFSLWPQHGGDLRGDAGLI
jgi:hypothetical protein